MQTVLTSDDFNFIIAALNDASLEIAEKQEAKQEEMYNRIEVELQGVQQALQSSPRSLHCASAIGNTRTRR
jgi:hypothetical protein